MHIKKSRIEQTHQTHTTKKTKLIDSQNIPKNAPFTPELASHRTIERRATNIAGQYGFRIRLLSDETGDARIVMAAERFVDDVHYACGARGERDMSGITGGGSPGGATQTQLDAQKRVREAKTAVGPVHAQILFDTLVDCLDGAKLGRLWKVTNKTATKWAKDAYVALADYYDSL